MEVVGLDEYGFESSTVNMMALLAQSLLMSSAHSEATREALQFQAP